MPRPTPAERVMPIDWSTRPSSSMATHSDVKSPSSPMPPNSSGTTRPNRPRSPIFGTRSLGKWWSLSHLAMCGSTSASANSRTTLRKSSCSLLSSNIALLRGARRRSIRLPATRHTGVVLLDVDVNVKQYSRVCQPSPPAAASRRPGRSARSRTSSRSPTGRCGTTRTSGLITPERRGTDPGLPPPRPHPAGPDPAGQAARLPARGDPHDHRPLRPAAGQGQPAGVRPGPDRRAPHRPRAAPPRPRGRPHRARRVRAPLPRRPRPPRLRLPARARAGPRLGA